ncbi:unnamed protein product, partial [Allacma fusca]
VSQRRNFDLLKKFWGSFALFQSRSLASH